MCRYIVIKIPALSKYPITGINGTQSLHVDQNGFFSRSCFKVVRNIDPDMKDATVL